MAYSGLTVEYMVNEADGRLFIPSNQDVVATVTEVDQCKALSPDGVAVLATGRIAVATTRSEGSGYTEGYYTDVPVTGGSGSGATLDCQYLDGSWAYILFQESGVGYEVGDIVSVDPANVGGTGSGLSMEVTQVF